MQTEQKPIDWHGGKMETADALAFIVYGSFTDPQTGENFVVFKIPKKGVDWHKQVIPAIRRIIKPWFPQQKFPYGYHFWDENRWDIDGGDDSFDLSKLSMCRQFNWNGEHFEDITPQKNRKSSPQKKQVHRLKGKGWRKNKM